MAIWNILKPFGIFYDHLVISWQIWYIFPVLVYCVKKNLATLFKSGRIYFLFSRICFHQIIFCHLGDNAPLFKILGMKHFVGLSEAGLGARYFLVMYLLHSDYKTFQHLVSDF
jgi:hypothetical protein